MVRIESFKFQFFMVRIESFKFQNKKRSKIYCKIEEMPDIRVINVRRQNPKQERRGAHMYSI